MVRNFASEPPGGKPAAVYRRAPSPGPEGAYTPRRPDAKLRAAMTRRKPRPVLGIRGEQGGAMALGYPATIDELGSAGDLGTRAHYLDTAYYAKTYAGRTEDVAYYVRLARRSQGPVLEYGTGSGRIALPIARAGVEITGVDQSAAMLRAFREQLASEPAEVRERVRLRRGDMRRVKLGRRFPLVIATFNSILHLYTRPDVERFLARVRDHLSPQGRLVFDYSLPRGEDLVFDPDRSYGASPIRHPSTGTKTRYAERFDYDPIRQVLLVEMEFHPEHGEPWSVPLTHRMFFPREIEALLHYNGFTDIRFTGDFTRHPPGADTDTLVVSARLRRTTGSRGSAGPGARKSHRKARRKR